MMFTRKKMDRLFGQLDNWLTVLIQAMIYYDFIVEAELKLLILIWKQNCFSSWNFDLLWVLFQHTHGKKVFDSKLFFHHFIRKKWSCNDLWLRAKKLLNI